VLRVGLTGVLACGKSTAAEMFARLGARVLNADRLAHELMKPGEKVYAEIVTAFGDDILAKNKTIDRKKLAAKAFAGRIEELNRIVHPAVIARQERWMDELAQSDPHGIAMVEAALILEAGVKSRFDKVVVVTCAPGQLLERFTQRTGLAPGEARAEFTRRMSAQLSDEAKRKQADYIIDNSGDEDATFAQVERIYEQLRAQAAGNTTMRAGS
jgi:dephospho-CoA kinase